MPLHPSKSRLLACFIATLLCQGADAQSHPLWFAGTYSFSDELGGFYIRSISGTGTKADPIVIEEELESANPVTLVIRAVNPADYPYRALYLRISALNNCGHPWVEFLVELQSVLGKPSECGDGLSFDQAHSEADGVSSSSFAAFSREFEPYDRIRFRDGSVDPRTSADFGFLITDFMPKSIFYLVEDPSIPSS
jgi:hypothetical protein